MMDDEVTIFELPAAEVMFHGTSAEEDFEYPEGPGWVSDERSVAEWFVGWAGGEGEPRILVYETTRVLRLVLIPDQVEMFRLLEDVYMVDDHRELAEEICRFGGDGWVVPNNYGSGDDIMLCDPASVLQFIEKEEP
jgi:hypothetical protein